MAICCMNEPEDFKKIEQKDLDFIDTKDDISEKVMIMMHFLRLTKKEIEERKYLHTEIVRLLKPYYPNCLIAAFGSTVNGFGFKGCDLDLLFLPFPEYCNLDFKNCEDVSAPSLSNVKENPDLKAKLLTLNENYHLKFVLSVLRSSKSYFFKRVTFIPAKCPILNIEFRQSFISCDLSASNRLVLCNTDLQRLYGNLDDRVTPLVMFFRYWAKSLGFIKKSLLSSYSLSILVIFYLQNTEPPILPSVKSLIELSGHSYKIDGWETAICKNISYIPRNQNFASIEQLLIGFFDFYWKFDFVRNIVSPHTGRAIPIKELLESIDDRIKTFQVTPFSIQDPFVLSLNISRNAAMKTSFKIALIIAKRFLQQKSLFLRLFDFSSYEAEMAQMFEPVLQNIDPSFVPCHLLLSYEMCSNLGISKELYLWHEEACQIVFNLLQYGLLFECEVIDKVLRVGDPPPFKKRRKCGRNMNSNIGNLELIMSMQCTVYCNTWHNRKKTNLNNIEPNLDKDEQFSGILQNEHYLSLVLNQSNETSRSPLAWFLCSCYKYTSLEIPDIVVVFSPLSNVKMFSVVAKFLKSYVPKLLQQILSERKSRNSVSW